MPSLSELPAFLISLDEQRARLATARVRRAGVAEPLLFRGYRNVGLKNDLEERRGRGGLSGEIGCFLSHLGVAKMAWALGLELFLIFEDDVVFHREFAKRMGGVLEDLPPTEKCDVLMLGHNINWPEERKGAVDETGLFLTPYENLWGTHAILATAKYAEFLSDPAIEMREAFDHQLYASQFRGELKIMAMREVLCGQDRVGLKSEIGPQREGIVPEGFDVAKDP